MDASQPRRYRFEGFELDTARRLLRYVDGPTVELSHRAFEVLALLVAEAGHDVSRESLMARVWPKAVVEDNNLDQAVSSIRRALGDTRTQPRFLMTIPGRGYRFVAEVKAVDDTPAPMAAPSPPPATPRWWRAALIGAIVVACAIALGWQGADESQPVADRTTTDAYQAYSAGLYHWQRREPGAHSSAVREFERAVALDPGFAEAWAALSGALAASVVFNELPAADHLPRALDAAERAVALDPRSGAARGALGHAVVLTQRDYAVGERHYAAALALEPRAAQVRMWRALNYAHLGRLEDAQAEIARAQQDDPRSMAIAANLGLLLHLGRRHDAAAVHLRRLLEVEPRSAQTRGYLARALLALDDAQGAQAVLDGASDRSPGGSAVRGRALAAVGRIKEARALAGALRARGVEGFAVSYDLAAIETALGDSEAACAALKAALADGSPGIGMLPIDPALDGLREKPCYQDVVTRARP
jgi:DNA-binding winged helix-turn-helix (wHTH) protein/Flp pilus assembly protein TadD